MAGVAAPTAPDVKLTTAIVTVDASGMAGKYEETAPTANVPVKRLVYGVMVDGDGPLGLPVHAAASTIIPRIPAKAPFIGTVISSHCHPQRTATVHS
jgi:hypothetical protein